MELGCIGFLVGAIVSIIMIGIGVLFGDYNDNNKRQHGLDNDITIYVPMRYRRGSRNKRDHQPTSEEIVDMLCVLRLGASEYEKSIIDYLIDKEEAE